MKLIIGYFIWLFVGAMAVCVATGGFGHAGQPLGTWLAAKCEHGVTMVPPAHGEGPWLMVLTF